MEIMGLSLLNKMEMRLTERKASLIFAVMRIFVLITAAVSYALTWSVETVNSTGDVGLNTSIALDSGDNPHISYYDYTIDDLT